MEVHFIQIISVLYILFSCVFCLLQRAKIEAVLRTLLNKHPMGNERLYGNSGKETAMWGGGAGKRGRDSRGWHREIILINKCMYIRNKHALGVRCKSVLDCTLTMREGQGSTTTNAKNIIFAIYMN